MPRERSQEDLDVDVRFLLANERTLLAWSRTALALLAGGVGLENLGQDLPGRTPIAAALVVAGIVVMIAGGRRHAAADAAIRRGELPSAGLAPYAVAGMVVVLGLALLVVILTAR